MFKDSNDNDKYFKNLSKVLRLRHVQKDDAVEIFSLVDESRASFREFLPWLDHNKSSKDTEKFLESSLLDAQNGTAYTFAIVEDVKIVGLVSYHPIDWQNKSADLGYWVSVRYRGRGFAKWAVYKLLEHAFDELKLHRISIACGVENRPSQRIPESLGFKFEGIKRGAEWLYDHFVDHKIYSILMTEWKALEK